MLLYTKKPIRARSRGEEKIRRNGLTIVVEEAEAEASPTITIIKITDSPGEVF